MNHTHVFFMLCIQVDFHLKSIFTIYKPPLSLLKTLVYEHFVHMTKFCPQNGRRVDGMAKKILLYKCKTGEIMESFVHFLWKLYSTERHPITTDSLGHYYLLLYYY